MGNMSYCRYENTYRDLKDCWDNFNDEPTSETEIKYRKLLVKLCQEIAEDAMI
uniref:Uncharacterized protein n=1 Tax=viral metagenome TaxID=1070528 RepID=A0A6M3J756_9ZZZZ